MNCNKCGAWNYDDVGFCGNCGKPLAKASEEIIYSRIPLETVIVCPKCGAKHVRTDSLCRSCGTSLDEVKRTIIANMAAQAQRPPPAVICGFCGGTNQVGQKFCSWCGRGLIKSEFTADPMVIGYLKDIKYALGWIAALLIMLALGGFIWFMIWMGEIR